MQYTWKFDILRCWEIILVRIAETIILKNIIEIKVRNYVNFLFSWLGKVKLNIVDLFKFIIINLKVILLHLG